MVDEEKIRAMREERDLSRQELAREAGIGVCTLRSVERRERVATGWRVALVFGMHPSEVGSSLTLAYGGGLASTGRRESNRAGVSTRLLSSNRRATYREGVIRGGGPGPLAATISH